MVVERVTAPGATLLEGRPLARVLRAGLRERIERLTNGRGAAPHMRVLLVGSDQDSVLYAQNIVRWCGGMGLAASLVTLPGDASIEAVVREIGTASDAPAIDGVLVQMPMPPHVPYHDVFCRLDPKKDIEGLTPENIGLLASGRPRFVPTTPLAGMELLDAYGIELEGKEAVILGRSNVVGRPLAELLLARDASVTVLHSHSRGAADHVRRADIVAAAAGSANLVRGDWLAPGAVVLDFGINFVGDTIVGDVRYDEAVGVARAITPVPGGIGPLTNVLLARNLVDACERASGGRRG